MTRDSKGRYAGADPIAAAMREVNDRQRGLLAQLVGGASIAPEESSEPVSFDGGARGTLVEDKPSMDEAMRDALHDTRAGGSGSMFE